MEGKINSLASPFGLTAVPVLKALSVIFCTCRCFPEAVKPCPKSHWVFTALNEMINKSKEYNTQDLSGGKGKKGK